MPSIDDMDDVSATHLLLCADTKMGKSDYVANAIRDGFFGIYIDADNGLNTLKKILPPGSDGRKRLKYIRTAKPYYFMMAFVESKGVFRWNLTQDAAFLSATAKPDDDVVEMWPAKIPPGVLFSLDSWTSTAFDAMEKAATDNSVSLADMKGKGQDVYGDANVRLTTLLQVLQKVRFHTIVQAHAEFYELMEKPPGVNNVKQKDMIIKDTLMIPKSCSRAHGYGMGKFFNEIGWLIVNRFDKQVLDFRKMKGRIGGGTPDGEGDPRKEFSFKNLFAEPVEFSEEEVSRFYNEYKASEFVAPQAAAKAPAPVNPAVPAGALPTAGNPVAKANPFSGLLGKK